MVEDCNLERCEILPLDEFQLAAYQLLMECPDDIKQCSRHSLIGINKAWGLKDVDREMSIFRALTAEEEIASGVIKALQLREYQGAKQLNPKNHAHKAAIWPFFQIVTYAFQPLDDFVDFKLVIETPEDEDRKRPRLRFMVLKPYDNMWYFPEPPLDFTMYMNYGEGSQIYYFKEQIDEYLKNKGRKDFLKLIKKRANFRNSLLYSRPGGIPRINGDTEKSIQVYRRSILSLNCICLLIAYYHERQLFIQQSLDALLNYLCIMGKKEFILP